MKSIYILYIYIYIYYIYCLFPTTIYTSLYSYVLSTVLCIKSKFYTIYIYIYLYVSTDDLFVFNSNEY